MNTAQRITKRMAETGRTRSKESIYAVVSDEHNVHCLTEAHLDCWWESQKPEDKAALYELHLDGALEEPVKPSVTVCGLSPKALENSDFVASLAAVARAGKIMLDARQLLKESEAFDA